MKSRFADAALSVLAIPFLFLLFILGVWLFATAFMAPDDLPSRPMLRVGMVFLGLVSWTPVVATSVLLRLRRVDRTTYDQITNGWRPTVYIAFVGGRSVLATLYPTLATIARNSRYPASLRRMAALLRIYLALMFGGLLVAAGAAVIFAIISTIFR
jgi:hypothetical protein